MMLLGQVRQADDIGFYTMCNKSMIFLGFLSQVHNAFRAGATSS